MRHRVAGRKLGRTTSHRTAMTRNMAASLIEHERIITTIQKAKTVKPFVEKLVTLSKDASPGGYCRILKLSKPRLGDNGQRVILEFVERTPEGEEEVSEE